MPKPLPDHPGHVFLEGEGICIPLPQALTLACTQWRLLDDRQQVLRSGALPADATDRGGPLRLDVLGIGWYRLEFGSTNQPDQTWTTLAVLRPLQARTPENSPVAVDSAAAWFAHDDATKQRELANLAALAGVSWVRDRLRWREIQPQAGALKRLRSGPRACRCFKSSTTRRPGHRQRARPAASLPPISAGCMSLAGC